MEGYSTEMVTRKQVRDRIRKGIGGAPRQLFVDEWRERRGISPEALAGRVGIERESYYRWLREPKRINRAKQAALEDALDLPQGGLNSPPPPLDAPPPKPSLDALAKDATPEQRDMLFDIARRLLGKTG